MLREQHSRPAWRSLPASKSGPDAPGPPRAWRPQSPPAPRRASTRPPGCSLASLRLRAWAHPALLCQGSGHGQLLGTLGVKTPAGCTPSSRRLVPSFAPAAESPGPRHHKETPPEKALLGSEQGPGAQRPGSSPNAAPSVTRATWVWNTASCKGHGNAGRAASPIPRPRPAGG